MEARSRVRATVAVGAAALLLFASACTGEREVDVESGPYGTALPTFQAPAVPWPGSSWQRDLRAAPRLAAEAARTGTHCVMVVQDGVVVHEWTAPGRTSTETGPVWSITKSVTALLVAVAARDGHLAPDDRVAEHVPAWRGGPSADVRIEHVLAQTSGRRWSHDLDYGQFVRQAADKTAFALRVGQQHPPGTHWEYNNAATQVLAAVLEGATGRSLAEYARSVLFDPLGMSETTWDLDATGSATTYSGLRSSCEDLARLGLFVARGGVWRDARLLDAAVVDQVTGESSSDLNAAYADLWWTNRAGRVQTIERAAGFGADAPPRTGRLAPDVPADARWAHGYGNQVLAVIPSAGTVAVRLGERPARSQDLGPGALARAALRVVADAPQP